MSKNTFGFNSTLDRIPTHPNLRFFNLVTILELGIEPIFKHQCQYNSELYATLNCIPTHLVISIKDYTINVSMRFMLQSRVALNIFVYRASNKVLTNCHNSPNILYQDLLRQNLSHFTHRIMRLSVNYFRKLQKRT